MIEIRKKGMLWYFLRGPVYLYRWHLGAVLGKRFVLLTHIGRRTGLRRQTVLEVVQYRREGPEVVVANGFGPNSDWVLNIKERGGEEVNVGSQHFAAEHRFLDEAEAVNVIKDYEYRNRFVSPIVRAGFSWLLGWKYGASDDDRHRLVSQIPLIAFRPRGAQAQTTHPVPQNA